MTLLVPGWQERGTSSLTGFPKIVSSPCPGLGIGDRGPHIRPRHLADAALGPRRLFIPRGRGLYHPEAR